MKRTHLLKLVYFSATFLMSLNYYVLGQVTNYSNIDSEDFKSVVQKDETHVVLGSEIIPAIQNLFFYDYKNNSTNLASHSISNSLQNKAANKETIKQTFKYPQDKPVFKKSLIDKTQQDNSLPIDNKNQGIVPRISENKQPNIQKSATAGFNLTPYQPSGWDNKIVLSTVTETNTSATNIYSNQVIYLDWAIINNGSNNITQTFYTKLYVDNVLKANYNTLGLNANYYAYVTDVAIGPLAAGNHTFKLVADANNNVSESNENDNEYSVTKNITVNEEVNLTPYQPSGWDNKIVLSTVTETNTSASIIYNYQIIYLDCAIANNGSANISQTFTAKLYIDDVLYDTQNIEGLNAGTYTYTTDVPIGPLAAGNHTFKLVADANNNITESNENDNEYSVTKNITVSDEVNLTPFQPAGWDNKIVLSTVKETNTSATSIYENQVIYLDWAIINDEHANIKQSFDVKLYVDDVLKASYNPKGLDANYYFFIIDEPIGPLTAGNHTFKIVADVNNNVTESNETDNEYSLSKTILVQGIPKINILPSSITMNKADIAEMKSPSHSFVDNSKMNPITTENKVKSKIKHYMKGSVIPDSVVEYWKNRKPPVIYPKSKEIVTATLDWSGSDSPVKDQGQCGSCWAFAAVGYVENLGLQTDLSEQVVLSCSNAGSCAGGSYSGALKYIQSTGVSYESCYPYIQANGNCENSCKTPIVKELILTVSDFLWGKATVNAMRNELQNGPLVVHMLVPDDDTFDAYQSGIYKFNGNTIPETNGHAVLLVGYDDTQQCFKVKNSWGPDWGDSGYFRISYDDVSSAVGFGSYAIKGSGVFTQDLSKNTFTISNQGNGNLIISSVTSNKNWLSISGNINTPFSISQSEKQYLTVAIDWSLVGATTQTGLLTVNSDDPNNPVVSVEIIAQTLITGIESNTSKRHFKIYPNPVLSELIIENEAQNEKSSFQIINSLGQIIYKGDFFGKTMVPTNHFSTGIYSVKVNNGHKNEFVKIVKK